ncbi:MAG: glycoside hydrolase family 13 protein [Vallitaleaceae bacterium]|jgi:alpha-glucosidase|nr:glycoside hydrolase family 13 protein [Vallitaleaceae bacterium]
MNITIPFDQLTKHQKILAYIMLREGILDERAIHSDATKNYRIPSAPKANEPTKVRIRTGKENVDQVYLCYNNKRVLLEVERSDDLFDYYSGVIIPGTDSVSYFFEIRVGNLKCYFNKKGVVREVDGFYNYKIIPGFDTPNWAKGAVMYQIFVDRFFNGDKTNDVLTNEYVYVGKPVKQVKKWNKLPEVDGIREFYGGDIQGIIDKLDYLEDLGVEVIYLNPIFVSPSNHKYDTQDYDYVDPHFGKIIIDKGELLTSTATSNEKATKYISRVTETINLEASNDLLYNFVEEAHRRDIRVILDGVFNHCGSFNKWIDKEKIYANSHNYPPGAYESIDSPYHSYFYFHDKNAWPDNNHYDGWWGFDTLPKLNYEGSPKLYNYILEIGKKWVSEPYNFDGWRLDVAADLGYTKEFNHQFWRDYRKSVKGANSEALIIAEHYGDPNDWIQGDQWDTVMNYDAFMEPVTWFLTGMQKHSDEFRPDLLGNARAFFDTMTHNMSRFHNPSLEVSMNELSNHDHSRFLTRTNHTVGRVNTKGSRAAEVGINLGIMKEAVAIQMTWPGAPTIYYGDEVGLCGWTDPDNRRSFPWGNENKDLLSAHRELIRIRKQYSALKTGSIKFLHAEHNIIAYGRWDDDNRLIVVLNNSDKVKEVKLPVWEIGISDNDTLEMLIETTREGLSTEEEIYFVYHGRLAIKLEPFSAVVMKTKVW